MFTEPVLHNFIICPMTLKRDNAIILHKLKPNFIEYPAIHTNYS